MTPIDIVKTVVSVAILAAAAYMAWDYIDCKKERAVLQNVIESADAQAKADADLYKENHDAIKSELANNTAILVDYYDRMLRNKDPARPGKPAAGPQRPDAAAGEPAACGRNIAFERACAIDALRLAKWQEWARMNRLPME